MASLQIEYDKHRYNCLGMGSKHALRWFFWYCLDDSVTQISGTCYLQIQAERSLAYGAQDYAAAAGLVKPSLGNGESLPGR